MKSEGPFLGLLVLAVCASSARLQAGGPLSVTVPKAGQVVIAWAGRGQLQSTTGLGSGWAAVSNALASPYTNQAGPAARFFRLNQTVDATTLHRKVLCGYQGWFRCGGDGGTEWDHWNRNWSAPPTTNMLSNLTFEMWPDVTDHSNKYSVTGFTATNGAQEYLFSSLDRQTVDTHFNWMLQYGIDGVVVQRFVTQTPPDNVQPWKTNVLLYARDAANRTGRAFCMEYDMSGANTNTLFSQLTNDWLYMVNTLKIPQDPRYLHHNGKPVLFIFGFYPDRFTNNVALPQRIISWFRTNSASSVTLVGSGEWEWRTETVAGWSNLFRSFDGYCPWNTGNYSIAGTNKYATTSYWSSDLIAATNAGMFYLPEIYPGFSWDNLQQLPPGTSLIPRLGGDFLWRQFNSVTSLGLDWAYVGMFDEVDEGTAIFKVSNTPPAQGHFVTYDGLPADWYLRLTAEGSKMLSGETPNTATIPISP